MNPHLMIALALCTTVVGASPLTVTASDVCVSSPIDPFPIGPIQPPPPASPFMATFCVNPNPDLGSGPCSPGQFQAGPCATQKANDAAEAVKEIDPSQTVADAMTLAMEKKEWAVDTADAPGRVQFAIDTAGDGIVLVGDLKVFVDQEVDWAYGQATGAVCNQLGQGQCQGLIPILP